MSRRSLSLLLLAAVVTAGVIANARGATEVYFSPNGQVAARIATAIDNATASIDVAVYELSHPLIAASLARRHAAGVQIRIITDRCQQSPAASRCPALRAAGIKLRNGNQRGLMHEKAAIIDGRVLLLGSANWTQSGDQRNAENLLVLDDPALITKYADHFARSWSASLDFVPAPVRRQPAAHPEKAFPRFTGPLDWKEFYPWLSLPVPSTLTPLPASSVARSSSAAGKAASTSAAWSPR